MSDVGSEYDVPRGGLKLKLKTLNKKSKLKLKHKANPSEKNKQLENVEKTIKAAKDEELGNSSTDDATKETNKKDSKSWMTEAQRKFLAQQEKRQFARVMEKAAQSHKQRVEKFNEHLENLSEHYDIPKVSWTK